MGTPQNILLHECSSYLKSLGFAEQSAPQGSYPLYLLKIEDDEYCAIIDNLVIMGISIGIVGSNTTLMPIADWHIEKKEDLILLFQRERRLEHIVKVAGQFPES